MPHSRWLIFLPVLVFALFAKPAKADVLGEWTYSQSCPTSGSIEVIDNTIILHGPDQGGCSGQPHWVKIETTIPADVDTIDFTWAYQTTDGAWYDPPQYGINDVYTMLTQENNATGELSVPVQEGDIFTFRQYSTDTCCQPGHLTISNLSLWESITTSTTSTTTTTTTSTVPETTVPVTNPTTTTVQETTTTVPETTTSVENSTSTTSSTTSTTTSSVPQTTTTESTTTTTQPPPPQTSTPPQTTQPAPVETSVPTTLPEPSTTTTSTTIEATTTTVPPPSTTTTTVQPTTTTQPPETSTTSIPDTLPLPPDTAPDAPQAPETSQPEPDAELPPITDEAVVEALADIEQATPTEVKAIITELLAFALTTDQAVSVASEPAILEVLTNEEAAEVFEQVAVEELSSEQATELVAAVQEAPTKVRKAFEAVLNLFEGFADDYVMTNQTVPIKTRRALIALSAVFLVSAPAPIRRNT